MIQWRFYFEQGDTITDASIDEDKRIKLSIEHNPHSLLDLPTQKGSLYINLKMVKCITRHENDDSPISDGS